MLKALYQVSVFAIIATLQALTTAYLMDHGFDIYASTIPTLIVLIAVAVYLTTSRSSGIEVRLISIPESEWNKTAPKNKTPDPTTKPTAKRTVSAETRKKISENAVIRERKKREQKARMEKTQLTKQKRVVAKTRAKTVAK